MDNTCWMFDGKDHWYEHLSDDEARKLVIKRVLNSAVYKTPPTVLVVMKDCGIKAIAPGCFNGDVTYKWDTYNVLYLKAKEELAGEEAQRIMALVKATATFDETNAKVMRLVFKKGDMDVKREWVETDVLYVGDMHFYYEYCFGFDPKSEDVAVHVVLTSNGDVIPVDGLEKLGKYAW